MTDRCARCKSDDREASVILVSGGPVLCARCALEELQNEQLQTTQVAHVETSAQARA